MVTQFRLMEKKIEILEKTKGQQVGDSQQNDSQEDRPDGLLVDKRKTLMNYVGIHDFDKVCRQFSD